MLQRNQHISMIYATIIFFAVFAPLLLWQPGLRDGLFIILLSLKIMNLKNFEFSRKKLIKSSLGPFSIFSKKHWLGLNKENLSLLCCGKSKPQGFESLLIFV